MGPATAPLIYPPLSSTLIRREEYWVKDPYKYYLVYLDYLFPFGFIRTVSALTQTNIYALRYPLITIIDHCF